MARKLGYWEFDADEIVTCPDCGWSGRAGDYREYYSEVFDVCCMQCDKMLLIVRSLVDIEETREAAAAGNQEAIEMLAKMDAQIADAE
jgi:hypothetical protein